MVTLPPLFTTGRAASPPCLLQKSSAPIKSAVATARSITLRRDVSMK